MAWCGKGQGGQARGAVSRPVGTAPPAAAESKFLPLSLDRHQGGDYASFPPKAVEFSALVMGSVVVTWKGRARDEGTRRALTERIVTLARIYDRFFQERTWTPHQVETYDCVLPEALVDSSLVPGQQASSRLTAAVPGYLSVRDLRVFGAAFSLPTLYRNDNWVSFVFLIDEDPALDGLLVRFDEPEQPSLLTPLHLSYSGSRLTGVSIESKQDREECNRIFEQRKPVLTVPTIHLRYTWEGLLDDLLGWVKHFYLPDLYYWRYGVHPGYQQFADLDCSSAFHQDQVFERLCDVGYYLSREH